MQAQELVIYGIVRKRLYEFLRPEYIDFFSGNTARLYEACFMLRMRKLDPNVEYITNYIHQSNEIKNKKEVIDQLHDIVTSDRHVDVLSLPKVLENEWYDERFGKLLTTLADKKVTLDIKKDMIFKTNDVINRTRKQDDFRNVKDILTKFMTKEKTSGNFQDALIRLQDKNLTRIFDDTIYPHMYSILGRPNDFKTSLMLNLILEFSKLDQPGILLSFEDSSEMASIKIFSLLSGLMKKSIIQHQYDKLVYEESLDKLKSNIYVMDKLRTADQTFIDIDNRLSAGDFKWIAVDFMQAVSGEKYLSEYEKINLLDRRLFELNKKHNIPVFRLSQAPKDKIQSGTILGMGDEKGSGEISHNSRYSISINKADIDDDTGKEEVTRRINVYKTTFCPKKEIDAVFHGATGKLVTVYNV